MDTRIAVCITVHNRHESAHLCLFNWRKYAPANCDIYIVDDGSAVPFPGATFRFAEQQGIAKAKNACLFLAEDYDYIFLSDDDFWPLRPNWHLPYIYSGLNHACYTFNRAVERYNDTYIEYELPCGCFLFLTKQVLTKVGGFDAAFSIWGYEHVSYSDRIFMAGLTPARYIDIPGSGNYFYSLDEAKAIKSSVSSSQRSAVLAKNKQLYLANHLSNDFKPYK